MSINWGTYIWAIVSDKALDAALGYYINPLFSVALQPATQADSAVGGLMTDAEVALALPMLAHAAHVRLNGISHVLHEEQKRPVLQAITEFLATAKKTP